MWVRLVAVEDPVDPDGDGGQALAARVLRPFVAEVVARRTGPDLLAGLLELADRGPLSAREQLEVTVAWKAMVGYCQAGQLDATVALDATLNPTLAAAAADRAAVPVRRTANELAPALRMAPRAASTYVALARRVDATLPAAADALAEGRIDYAHLRVVDDIVRDLPPASRAQVEAAAVGWAPTRTAQQLRTDLTAEAHRLDPEHATKAAERGVGDRDVVLRPSPLDGCQRLVADLPTLDAALAWEVLNTAAKHARQAGVRPDASPEGRTCAQSPASGRCPQRADLLTAILTGQAALNAALVPPREHLAKLAEVQVVVAAVPARGRCPQPCSGSATCPRTRWRRLMVDPDTGTLIHADPHTTPPEDDPPGQPPTHDPDDDPPDGRGGDDPPDRGGGGGDPPKPGGEGPGSGTSGSTRHAPAEGPRRSRTRGHNGPAPAGPVGQGRQQPTERPRVGTTLGISAHARTEFPHQRSGIGAGNWS